MSGSSNGDDSSNDALGGESTAPTPCNGREIVEVRRKIVLGFYDRPDVLSQTARKLLKAGDLPGNDEA